MNSALQDNLKNIQKPSLENLIPILRLLVVFVPTAHAEFVVIVIWGNTVIVKKYVELMAAKKSTTDCFIKPDYVVK